MPKKHKRVAIGFFTDEDGEVKPLTKALVEMKRKKVIRNPRSFKGIFPSKAERIKVEKFITTTKNELAVTLKSEGLKARLQDVGSTAKGTFVKGDYDVDIYVITSTPENAYEVSKRLHPKGERKYGELLIWHFREKGFDVDLVFVKPDFRKKDTLKHTSFFKAHLTPKMRKEVVKAKAFFKTKGLYSADIGGITGVCLEELVRQHGTLRKVCQHLSRAQEKPFAQDPVLETNRDLLASVSKRRWRGIQKACRGFLKSGEIVYRPFSEKDFRKRYQKYVVLQFPRRRDRAIDFSQAQAIAVHTANELRNYERDVKFDSDVYVTENKILIALRAPKRIRKTKLIRMHKRHKEAAKAFRDAHPDSYEKENYIYARVPRRFTKPLAKYEEEIRKKMG